MNGCTRHALLGTGALVLATAATLLSSVPAGALPQQAGGDRFVRWARGPASVLMLPDELELLPAIRTPARQDQFLSWFWSRRDPDPSTASNEFRRTFAERLAFADKEFAEPERQLPGWATPRGRLYLLMGPPIQRFETFPVFVVQGRLRPLIVWQYEHPAVSGRTVRFFFVRTSSGVMMASLQRGHRLSPEQLDCLEAARSILVRNRGTGPFAQAADRHAEALPGSARLLQRGEGVLVDIALPLSQLLGQPSESGIRYRFALAARQDEPSEPLRERDLGTLTFELSPDAFHTWSDSSVRVVIWMPSAADAYLLTELPTGRTLTVRTSSLPTAQEPVPVARRLVHTPLMGDRGVAFAYLPVCAAQSTPTAYLVDSRQQDASGKIEPLPGGRLAWLPVRDHEH